MQIHFIPTMDPPRFIEVHVPSQESEPSSRVLGVSKGSWFVFSVLRITASDYPFDIFKLLF